MKIKRYYRASQLKIDRRLKLGSWTQKIPLVLHCIVARLFLRFRSRHLLPAFYKAKKFIAIWKFSACFESLKTWSRNCWGRNISSDGEARKSFKRLHHDFKMQAFLHIFSRRKQVKTLHETKSKLWQQRLKRFYLLSSTTADFDWLLNSEIGRNSVF